MLASKTYKFKISDMEITATIDNSFVKASAQHLSTAGEAAKNMHCHTLHEMFFVKETPLVVLTEDKPLEFKNCVVCIPPMFIHNSIRHDDLRLLFSYKATEKTSCDFTAFWNSLFCAPSPRSVNINDLLRACFEQLSDLVHESDRLSDEMITSVLKLIFYNIYSCNASIPKSEKTEARDSYLITIESVLVEYQKNISLQSMADTLNLSTKQTSRIIRKNYKCTLSELLAKKRLGVACALLANSDMAVADIVEYINFPSESCFYHQFKKAYGCTPLKYRKSRKGNGEKAQE
jgi:AraC-like DNA-binding protein